MTSLAGYDQLKKTAGWPLYVCVGLGRVATAMSALCFWKTLDVAENSDSSIDGFWNFGHEIIFKYRNYPSTLLCFFCFFKKATVIIVFTSVESWSTLRTRRRSVTLTAFLLFLDFFLRLAFVSTIFRYDFSKNYFKSISGLRSCTKNS